MEKKIVYIPVVFVETPTETQKEIKEMLAKSTDVEQEHPQNMQQMQVPKPADTKKTIYMEEGEYICYRFAKTMYRGKPKTILFLSRIDAEGEEIP